MDVRLRSGLLRWGMGGAWTAFGADLVVVLVFGLILSTPRIEETATLIHRLQTLNHVMWAILHGGHALVACGLVARLWKKDPATALIGGAILFGGELIATSIYVRTALVILQGGSTERSLDAGVLVVVGLGQVILATSLARHRVGPAWVAMAGFVTGIGTALVPMTQWPAPAPWLMNLHLVLALLVGLVAAPAWCIGLALDLGGEARRLKDEPAT